MTLSFQNFISSIQEVYLDDKLLGLLCEEKKKEAMENEKFIQAFTFLYDVRGKQYNGFYVCPREIENKKLPVILFNRGGTGMFGVVKQGAFFIGTIASFVRSGYIVIGSQCMGFSENGALDEMGGEDFYSVLALKQLIDADEFADQSRIGLYGISRGGMTTYRLLAETDWAKAAVVVSGVTDMIADAKFRPELAEHYKKVFGGSENEMKKRSVMYWSEKLPKSVPILIMHGSADWRVDPRLSLRLSEKMMDFGIPHRLVIFEGNDHHLSESAAEVSKMELNWMDRFVKQGGILPVLEKHGK